MTNLIRIGAMLGAILVTSSAHAAVSNRAECYDVVIAACNKTDHAQSCAKSGMDQCDKQFKKIAIPTSRGPDTYKAN